MTLLQGISKKTVYLSAGVGTHDRAILWEPFNKPAWSPAVMYFHGSGGVYNDMEGQAQLSSMIMRLTGLGCTVLSADFGDSTIQSHVSYQDDLVYAGIGSGQNSFGTHAFTARVEAWRSWMDAHTDADVSKLALVGHSMGGYNICRYYLDYPDLVSGCVIFNGAVDINYIRANRAGSPLGIYVVLGALIDLAWGIAEADAIPSYSNVMTSDMAGLNATMLYSANDPLLKPEWAVSLAGYIGDSCTLINVGNTSHFAFGAFEGTGDYTGTDGYYSGQNKLDSEIVISRLYQYILDAA